MTAEIPTDRLKGPADTSTTVAQAELASPSEGQAYAAGAPRRNAGARRSETAASTDHRKTVLICLGVVFGMLGMSYAAVPLYDLFCRVTGYGGTTQVATQAPDTVLERSVVVRFDADVAKEFEWDFTPVEPRVAVQVGESGLAFYRAVNTSDEPVVGMSVFNVTPQKAAVYFNKVQCFCFEEQVLAAGESVEMPVSFFVDPDFVDDPQMDDVSTITLSYTFFAVEDPSDAALEQLKSLQSAQADDPATQERVAVEG